MNVALKISLKAMVVWALIFVGLGLAGYKYVGHLKQAAVEAQLEKDKQWQLKTADIEARAAANKKNSEELVNILKAANELNGKLVAALKLTVPKRDTFVVHDTLPTMRQSDSTRTAMFRDSSFAGVIEGKVTAPPFPAPLGVQYSLTRPAFSPKVGLVQVGSKYVWVVEWQGERFNIDAPYAPTVKKKLPWFGLFAALNYDQSQRIGGRVGARVTPKPDLEVKGGLDSRRGVLVEIEKKF